MTAAFGALLCAWACSSSDLGPAGGPVTGAIDTHCTRPDGGAIVQPTSTASCNVTLPDAGPVTYGDTMYNAEADDDDCKYHLKFTATPVYESSNVNFKVVLTNKVDGGVAAGANTQTEIFLSSVHPAPNTNSSTVESPPGTYAIGPVQFDQKGRWTVRFHFYETCSDELADSPHGHAAFYVDGP